MLPCRVPDWRDRNLRAKRSPRSAEGESPRTGSRRFFRHHRAAEVCQGNAARTRLSTIRGVRSRAAPPAGPG